MEKLAFELSAGGSGVLVWLPTWKITTQSLVIAGSKYSSAEWDNAVCQHIASKLGDLA